MSIQRQAAHVMGFDEDHTSILESREVAAQLNAILGSRPHRQVLNRGGSHSSRATRLLPLIQMKKQGGEKL